ncbi:hypothetical protein AOLI_G00249450 [Acnodon oligacanthus]
MGGRIPGAVLEMTPSMFSGSDDRYPYRGYIQVELELAKDMSGSTEPVTALALVCPDPRFSDSIPVLVGTNIDPSRFDFGDSPILAEWKERLSRKLAEISVFSMDEWDVGLAREVEHSIKLRDDRPFRERSRRIAPADLDDLRRHLQGLLAARIIKESRSPYASPIVLVRR